MNANVPFRWKFVSNNKLSKRNDFVEVAINEKVYRLQQIENEEWVDFQPPYDSPLFNHIMVIIRELEGSNVINWKAGLISDIPETFLGFPITR